MKNVLLLFSMFFLTSCSKHEIIHYSYKGVDVTRIDEDAESYFYYGYFTNKDKLPDSYIKATYHGFDGSMDSYFIFQANKKVACIGLVGWFEQFGKDSSIYIKEFENIAITDNWLDSIRHDLNNIVKVRDVIKLEKEDNKENHSQVKVVY